MTTKTNADVRELMRTCRVRQYEIAEKMGVSQAGISRRLREEMPDKEKRRMARLIRDIAKGRVKAG